MRRHRPVAIDFETFGVEGRPKYPPQPVGVAIKYPSQPAKYYSWGHVTGGNNTSYEDARNALLSAWAHPGGLLFHHAKFDVEVAEAHFGAPRLDWSMYHDTMLLLFLADPNSKAMGLKPSAERLLGLPPEEQDAVAEWLMAHQPVQGVKIGRAAKGKHPPGAYIAYAPAEVVAPYAIGDVDRTASLFGLLYPRVVSAGMGAAYDRERKLMLLLLDNERRGLRVDVEKLGEDEVKYTRVLTRTDRWIQKRIGADIDISAKQQLAAALVACGATTEERLGLTATGKLSSSKDALEGALDDKTLMYMLRYRGFLATTLQTFIRPWLAATTRTGGILHTSWNQVHSSSAGGESVGTRTGRPSTSNPNFLNVPKEGKQYFNDEKKGLPPSPIALPPLPAVRRYILPREKGHVLLDRDYSQQEPRLLAHFEGGVMQQQYLEDPWIDFHDSAKQKVDVAFRRDHLRKDVKNINLGLIYGMGVGKMAEKNNASVAETKALKEAILKMYPGLKALNNEMKLRAARKEPITTWGGRVYYCEPPMLFEGKVISFEYKLVNTLIQGSAADVTKEAMLRYAAAKPAGHELLLQVYDQLLASVPADDLHTGMETLRQTMESVELDVPMLSEGDYSFDNWNDVKHYDKKGKRVEQ